MVLLCGVIRFCAIVRPFAVIRLSGVVRFCAAILFCVVVRLRAVIRLCAFAPLRQYKSPVIGHWPSVVGHRLSIIGHRSPTAVHPTKLEARTYSPCHMYLRTAPLGPITSVIQIVANLLIHRLNKKQKHKIKIKRLNSISIL